MTIDKSSSKANIKTFVKCYCQEIQEMFVCKTLCPLKLFFLQQMFCTTGLVSSKLVAQMYEEEIHFRNC